MDPWFKKSLSKQDLRGYTRRHVRRDNFFTNLSVTGWLILINVVLFALGMIALLAGFDIKYIAIQPIGFLQNGLIWTLITSMFMHGGFFHHLLCIVA